MKLNITGICFTKLDVKRLFCLIWHLIRKFSLKLQRTQPSYCSSTNVCSIVSRSFPDFQSPSLKSSVFVSYFWLPMAYITFVARSILNNRSEERCMNAGNKVALLTDLNNETADIGTETFQGTVLSRCIKRCSPTSMFQPCN